MAILISSLVHGILFADPDGLFGLANVFIEGQKVVKWLRLPNRGDMHSQSAIVSAYRNFLPRPIPLVSVD